MAGKGNLWILPNMHKKNRIFFITIRDITIASTVLTIDEAGCPNLLCHKVKGVDKDELHCVKEVVKKGEFFFTRY